MSSRYGSGPRSLGCALLVATLALVGCSDDGASDTADEAVVSENSSEVTTGESSAADEVSGSSDGDAVAADFEPIMLDVTTSLGGPDVYHNVALTNYLEAVRDASGGLIDHEWYYAGSLVPATEVADALSTGLADLAIAAPAFTPDTFPIANWIASLASLGEEAPPAMMLARTAAAMEVWQTEDALRTSDFEDNGLVSLTQGMLPIVSYHLLCSEPVTDLASAAGKQVRTAGEVWAEEAANLGMEPVFLSGAEMFEAMQRGVIDCVMADAPDMISTGVWEVADNFTYSGFTGFVNGGAFFSKGTWDDLPVEAQQIMWDQLPVYLSSLASLGLEGQRQFIEEGADQGIEFLTPDAEMQSAIDDFQANSLVTVDGAPDAVEDPQAVLDAYSDLADKWDSIVVDDLGVTPYGTWEDWVASGDVVDTDAWAQRVYEEIFLPGRP